MNDFETCKRATILADTESAYQLAKRVVKAEDEKAALEAHVERLREGLHQALIHWRPNCADEDGIAYAECEQRCDEAPTTSLARLKAEWQAEGMERLFNQAMESGDLAGTYFVMRQELRRQAEGGE